MNRLFCLAITTSIIMGLIVPRVCNGSVAASEPQFSVSPAWNITVQGDEDPQPTLVRDSSSPVGTALELSGHPTGSASIQIAQSYRTDALDQRLSITFKGPHVWWTNDPETHEATCA